MAEFTALDALDVMATAIDATLQAIENRIARMEHSAAEVQLQHARCLAGLLRDLETAPVSASKDKASDADASDAKATGPDASGDKASPVADKSPLDPAKAAVVKGATEPVTKPAPRHRMI